MKEQEQNIQKEPYALKLNSIIVGKTEDIIHDLKRGLPSDKRRKLNRSKFFEILLEALISDYESQRQNSNVQRIIAAWGSSE